MEIDLNAPAFGPGSQKPETEKPEAPAAETVVEPAEKPEVKEEVKETEETSEEESQVPYSRFKKFHSRAKELEEEAKHYKQEAEEWRAKAETIKPQTQTQTDELPDYWKKLYGDSEASQEAWKVQRELNEALKEEARKEALEAVRNDRKAEQERQEANLEAIESQFEDLSALVGRDLTEKEQSAVLDIVDEFTPKDKDGNYLGATIPFEKAWEIYGLKNQASKAPKIQSRDQVASLTGAHSQGSTSISEKDKNFNPLDWNAWKSKI